MTYRDRTIKCPRCEVELQRPDARERWECGKCRGLLVGVELVIKQVVRFAPDLAPPKGVPADLTTYARRTTEPVLRCPVCADTMEPVFLGGVDVDRCYGDAVIWFDRGEIEIVIDRAAEQHEEREKSWVVKLFGF